MVRLTTLSPEERQGQPVFLERRAGGVSPKTISRLIFKQILFRCRLAYISVRFLFYLKWSTYSKHEIKIFSMYYQKYRQNIFCAQMSVFPVLQKSLSVFNPRCPVFKRWNFSHCHYGDRQCERRWCEQIPHTSKIPAICSRIGPDPDFGAQPAWSKVSFQSTWCEVTSDRFLNKSGQKFVYPKM